MLADSIPRDRRWRILVCGGRYNRDYQQMDETLDQLWSMCHHRMALIEGGHPTGTDLWALQWAQKHMLELELHHMVAAPGDMQDTRLRAQALWAVHPDAFLHFPGPNPLANELHGMAFDHRVPVWRAPERLEAKR
jgi:hypothetical protein